MSVYSGNSTANAYLTYNTLWFNSATSTAFSITKPAANSSFNNYLNVGPLGGNAAIQSGPWWSGLHLTPPLLQYANGVNAFPRTSMYYSYTNTTGPTDLYFNIANGNDGGIGTGIKIYASGTDTVLRGIDIAANGNVGIGTDSPSSRLHVANEIRIGRTDASSEGGEIKLCRSIDDVAAYSIDVNGNTTNPEFRIFNPIAGTVFFAASNTGVRYIKFDPTAANIGDANCLDDYEEGTWTPTFTASAGTATHNQQVGYYRKIGSQVTVWFIIRGLRGTLSSGNLAISGLPFTSFNSNMDYGYSMRVPTYWGTWTVTPNSLMVYNNTNNFYIWDASTTTLSYTALSTTGECVMHGQINYITSS